MLKQVTPKELRKLKASQFKEGDMIDIMIDDNRKYTIHISYKNKYGSVLNTPSLCTWIEDNNFNAINCTPGSSRGFTPYYIDDFKSR